MPPPSRSQSALRRPSAAVDTVGRESDCCGRPAVREVCGSGGRRLPQQRNSQRPFDWTKGWMRCTRHTSRGRVCACPQGVEGGRKVWPVGLLQALQALRDRVIVQPDRLPVHSLPHRKRVMLRTGAAETGGVYIAAAAWLRHGRGGCCRNGRHRAAQMYMRCGAGECAPIL